MDNDGNYPAGTVRALLNTDRVTKATRAALQARLEIAQSPITPRFFDAAAFAVLCAAAARLVPTGNQRPTPEELAQGIDDRLADDKSDGWRYDTLPPDGDAYRLGLRGLNETAQFRFGAGFLALDSVRQDAVLDAVQRGNAEGETWKTLPAVPFFEELLAELVECCYSHPLMQERIGYAGMADAQGWQRLGLNILEPWEPVQNEKPA